MICSPSLPARPGLLLAEEHVDEAEIFIRPGAARDLRRFERHAVEREIPVDGTFTRPRSI